MLINLRVDTYEECFSLLSCVTNPMGIQKWASEFALLVAHQDLDCSCLSDAVYELSGPRRYTPTLEASNSMMAFLTRLDHELGALDKFYSKRRAEGRCMYDSTVGGPRCIKDDVESAWWSTLAFANSPFLAPVLYATKMCARVGFSSGFAQFISWLKDAKITNQENSYSIISTFFFSPAFSSLLSLFFVFFCDFRFRGPVACQMSIPPY
jgi:hypothetical protein